MFEDSVNDSQALPEGLLPDDFHLVSAVVYSIFVHVRHTGRNIYFPEVPALLHGIGLDSFRSFRENYLLYVLQMVDEILFDDLHRLELQLRYRRRNEVRRIVNYIV